MKNRLIFHIENAGVQRTQVLEKYKVALSGYKLAYTKNRLLIDMAYN